MTSIYDDRVVIYVKFCEDVRSTVAQLVEH